MGRVEVDRSPPTQRCLRRRALCDTLDSATGETALPTRVCFASLAVGLVGLAAGQSYRYGRPYG